MNNLVTLQPHKKNKDRKNNEVLRQICTMINYISLPLIILLAWWYVTKNQMFPSAILPSINTVGKSLVEQVQSGQLFDDVTKSLIRVLKGFAIASVLGVILGVSMGISKSVSNFFSLTFSGIRQIPMMAWIPLIILWFGIGEESKVIIIVIGAFFPVLVNTINGIKQIPQGYIEVGRMLKLSKWDMFRKVYFPSAIPSIFVGLKLALGFSWMIVVAAELIAASSGVGYRINDARSLMQPEVVIVGMLVIALIGVLMDQILVRVSKLITPWDQKR